MEINNLDSLIFDRTVDDVISKNKKGYYNYNDLNRIEKWCEYVSNLLNECNYFNPIIVKTDWKTADFPTFSQLERISNNLKILQRAYFYFTQAPENLNRMTWQKANDVEHILDEIDKIIRSMKQVFAYSGVANCGQNWLWQQRFRRTYLTWKIWSSLEQRTWQDLVNTNITTWGEIM